MADIISHAQYCVKCGSPDLVKTRRSMQCNSCGFLFFLNPAAATGVILLRGTQALFVRRSADPGKGMLDLPGGFLEPHETLEEGAVREIKEELSLEIRSGDLEYLCSFPNVYNYKGTTYYTLDAFFTVSLPQQSLEIREDRSEVYAASFLHVYSLNPQELAFESHRKALEILKNSSRIMI